MTKGNSMNLEVQRESKITLSKWPSHECQLLEDELEKVGVNDEIRVPVDDGKGYRSLWLIDRWS